MILTFGGAKNDQTLSPSFTRYRQRMNERGKIMKRDHLSRSLIGGNEQKKITFNLDGEGFGEGFVFDRDTADVFTSIVAVHQGYDES